MNTTQVPAGHLLPQSSVPPPDTLKCGAYQKRQIMKQPSRVRKTALPAIFSAVLCAVFSAGAQQSIGWHDRMTLQLGDGVALNRQQEPAFPGIISSLSLPVTSTGGWSESYTYAQHTYDIVSSVSANSAVSLNALVFGGDVNVSFFGRHTFDANDLTFIYTASLGPTSVSYDAAVFSSNFWNQVAVYRKSLQDEALHSAITSTFGTHYVSGYQATRMVAVVYTFHYASASARQQSSLSASGGAGLGGVGDVNFSTSVNNFFADTNTTASMSYDFWSSDPQATNNPGFASAGVITNPQQFLQFVGQLRTYVTNMSLSHAKITGYILSPIQTVAGYSSLFSSSFQIPIANPANYDGFLQAYAALQAWKQHFDPWILDGDAMSWLNAQGRQQVLGEWFTAENHLATMKSLAAGHFTTNAPLAIPADIVNYLATLNDISLPRIYSIKGASFPVVVSGNYYMLGLVDCGCSDQTIAIPFNNLSELYYGTNNGSLVPIYYDAQDFKKAQLGAYPSGTVHNDLQTFFNGTNGTWPSWTNAANISGHRYGFFLATQPVTHETNWSLVISGGTDANGNALVVDEMYLSDQTRVATPSSVSLPCTITITNLAGTNLASVSTSTATVPASGLVAAVQPITPQGGLPETSAISVPVLFSRNRNGQKSSRAGD